MGGCKNALLQIPESLAKRWWTLKCGNPGCRQQTRPVPAQPGASSKVPGQYATPHWWTPTTQRHLCANSTIPSLRGPFHSATDKTTTHRTETETPNHHSSDWQVVLAVTMDGHSLHEKASQETLASLLQLDPSPIESPLQSPNTDKDLPPLPSEHSDGSQPYLTPRSTGLGLSGHGQGHGAIFYRPSPSPFPPLPPKRQLTLSSPVTRIQRYSSYTFSVFATLHLATTSLIPLVARSVPASESYLLLAREIYQTPLSEPLLVGLPILAHVGAGIALRLVRRSQNLKRYGRNAPAVPVPFSYIAVSGYGFAWAVAAHMFVNRGLPLAVEGDSSNIGLAYVAHGFVRHRVVSWVAYGALLGLGCGHMVWGWAKWFGLAQGAGWKVQRFTGNAVLDKETRRRRRRRLLLINGAAAAGVVVWAAGGLGIVARGGETLGWVGKIYDGLLDRIPGF